MCSLFCFYRKQLKLTRLNEIIQFWILVAGLINLCSIPLPPFLSFVNKNDIIPNIINRFHIMTIDNRGDIVILCNVCQQLINYSASYRI